MQTSFRTQIERELPYPIFFPDATRGMVKGLDKIDIKNTNTPGVLVNTYHLWRMIPEERMRKIGGVRKLMGYDGAVISDSGGFQVMSLVKRAGGKVVDDGVWFKPDNSPRMLLTPELSVKYQLAMKTDLVVVLDDFTPEGASERQTRETVERTIMWAKRSKDAFVSQCERLEIPPDKRPYLIAVNQGGKNIALRKECNERLSEIGFDGYGHGGDGFDEERGLDMELSRAVVESAPPDSLFYGLGVGKPEDVTRLYRQGFQIFDCVLPTRDARHGRLYVYDAKSIEKIDISTNDFYSYFVPKKSIHQDDDSPISTACDCHTCKTTSRSYLNHLFKVNDTLAYRLASIHNLRFYSILTEKLRAETSVIK